MREKSATARSGAMAASPAAVARAKQATAKD